MIPPENATDGQYLLLSWTSQVVGGGLANGIYEIQLAVVQFDAIPTTSDSDPAGTGNPFPSPTAHSNPPHANNAHDAVESVLHVIKYGESAGRLSADFFLGRSGGLMSILILSLLSGSSLLFAFGLQ